MTDKGVPKDIYVQDISEGVDRRARFMARVMKALDRRGLETDQLMSKVSYDDGLFRAAKADKVSGADEFVKSHLDTHYHRIIFQSELGELTPERAEFFIRHHRETFEWERRLSHEDMVRLYELLINQWRGLANGLGLDMEMPQCILKGDSVTKFVFTKQ